MVQIKTELEFSDPNLTYSLNKLSKKVPVSFDEKTSQEAVDLIYLLPDGFKAKSMVIDDLTTISLNLGQVELTDNSIKCHYLIRSPLTSAREELTNEIKLLSSLLNARVQIESDYPGWNYEANSFMRDILKEVIKEIDLKYLMLETDSPFLTPEPYRGKQNEPYNIVFVANKIAEIKEISLGEVLKQTTLNAIEQFDLKINL